MAQTTPHPEKWEAKLSRKLEKAKADQIWPLFADFFGIKKWCPNLQECYPIHGSNGEPGCIRYIVSSSGQDKGPIRWAKERLVAIDHAQMTLTYDFPENNMGLVSYVAYFKVVPGVEGEGGGCVVEWGFSTNPVAGIKLENMVSTYEVVLQLLVKNMEDDVVLGKSSG